MTDTLARNNQYSAGMMIAESLEAGKRGMMQPRYPIRHLMSANYVVTVRIWVIRWCIYIYELLGLT